ncbi:MAG TPA: hypothetical protein VES97_01030, partial [Solirubrobacteraceae bacterium]|nr:hypothetical protein [Solirubrobacteraceae bacterium]
MRALRPAAGLLAALATAVMAAACGGGSSTASVLLDAHGSAAAAAAAANPVAVSPLPGTPDASPSTQISFLGAAATSVSGVRVVGSRSGAHAGVLRAYSTATGASFLPSRPFLAGERVSVRARIGTGGATRAASTTFTIASQAAVDERPFPTSPGD